MVIALVDSSVVIDLLRGYPNAIAWYSTQIDLGISRIVWLEVVEGAPNQQKQRQAIQFLRTFAQTIEIEPADGVWALTQLMKFHLSHNVDAFDCLIASASARLNIPLYTRNLKHFAPLLGSMAQVPYV